MKFYDFVWKEMHSKCIACHKSPTYYRFTLCKIDSQGRTFTTDIHLPRPGSLNYAECLSWAVLRFSKWLSGNKEENDAALGEFLIKYDEQEQKNKEENQCGIG